MDATGTSRDIPLEPFSCPHRPVGHPLTPRKMRIVSACPEDADALSRIAVAAKRHWGYPENWIQRWRGALTLTPDYVATNPTFVAVVANERAGFYALQIRGSDALLDHLWVLPAAMGKGLGRALFAHAERIARQAGATRMSIVGDPHAEGFYLRMGAVVHGREAAPMDGEERYLPLFAKAL